MRKAFIYASIVLTILMLFTANSVVASGYANDVIYAHSYCTDCDEIKDAPDNDPAHLGQPGNPDGYIMVTLDDFYNGWGYYLVIYGFDIDDTPEQFEVWVGGYHPPGAPEFISVDPVGSGWDDDTTYIYFDFSPEITLNMVYLETSYGVDNLNTPGPDVDAVYAVH